MTTYDVELLEKLNHEIKIEKVLVHENTVSFFEDIEKYYPMGFSGVDWSKVESVLFYDLRLERSGIFQKFAVFLQQIHEKHPEFKDEKVVVIGDGLTTMGFEMKFEDLIELCQYFISIPQHTNMWFLNINKCINITFEGELYFG